MERVTLDFLGEVARLLRVHRAVAPTRGRPVRLHGAAEHLDHGDDGDGDDCVWNVPLQVSISTETCSLFIILPSFIINFLIISYVT
jgi:hypothetical protein